MERFVAAFFIAFHVDDYRQPGLCLVTDNQPHNVLQAGEGLTPPSDKYAQVITGDIDYYRRYGLFFLIGSFVLGEYRLVLECYRAVDFHQIKQLFYSISGYSGYIARVPVYLVQQRNSDNSIIGTQAEDAGLTFSYDLYFDLFPAYAELL